MLATKDKPAKSTGLGHLDPELQPVDGRDGAWSAQSQIKLHYIAWDEGTICVRANTGAQWLKSHSSLQDMVSGFETSGKTIQIVFRAHATLDETPWPARPADTTFRLVSHNVKTRTKGTEATNDDTHWLDVVLEWCAPGPAVTATTRYVTATVLRTEGVPALYVWTIDGTATPREGKATP